MRQLLAFLHDDSGPTAVEYAVMLAMILLVVITSIAAFGQAQNGMWGRIGGDLQAHGF